jgi:hypothetical protein
VMTRVSEKDADFLKPRGLKVFLGAHQIGNPSWSNLLLGRILTLEQWATTTRIKSPLPLHQPELYCQSSTAPDNASAANGEMSLDGLSQPRGPVQSIT